MKIDRRCFLALGIGGAAGTALSPLPWKLMDDSSIWSQMWQWTPVPAGGEGSHTTSTCTLCKGGCGISVRKVGNRVVKIEGLPQHPINDGSICLLGLAGPQLLYGPQRIKRPLKRVGDRGLGRWKAIGWDEAETILLEKLQALRAEGQAHSVACVSGRPAGTVSALINRFLSAYGSPNFLTVPTAMDTYQLVLHHMHGVQGIPGFDFENCDFVLSFGCGLLEGWGSPVWMFKNHSAWKSNGGKLFQIEPRLSNTAAKADQWTSLKPGSEIVLAKGLAHIIIAKGLVQEGFVNRFTNGFNDFKKDVAVYTPEKVAAATGVSVAELVQIATAFASAKHPIAVCGRGKGTQPGAMAEYAAVHALNALVGSLHQAGGIWSVPLHEFENWPVFERDAVAANGMQQARIDGAGQGVFADSNQLLNRLTGALQKAEPYPIQALILDEANPLYTLADSQAVAEALETVPFIVSFSSFMDETANYADLLLPNHTYLERYEDVPVQAGLPVPVVGLAKPVVEPQHMTKHTGDVILSLARALGGTIAGAFAWETYQACLESTYADQWQTLTESGYWVNDKHRVAAPDSAFDTDSGKFEFAASTAASAQIEIEGDATQYPLTLIPYESMRLAEGALSAPPFMVKAVEDTVIQKQDGLVEINPQTAQALGLPDGCKALLSTPKGQAKVRVHHYNGIQADVVALPRGLGHQLLFDKIIGGKGVNVNALIGPVEDKLSGLDVAWGIRAKLVKA